MKSIRNLVHGVANGATSTITLTVDTSVALEEMVTNTATITRWSFDPVASNDSGSDMTYMGTPDPLCSGDTPVISMDFGPGEITCQGVISIETSGPVNLQDGAAVHFVSPDVRLAPQFNVHINGSFDVTP